MLQFSQEAENCPCGRSWRTPLCQTIPSWWQDHYEPVFHSGTLRPAFTLIGSSPSSANSHPPLESCVSTEWKPKVWAVMTDSCIKWVTRMFWLVVWWVVSTADNTWMSEMINITLFFKSDAVCVLSYRGQVEALSSPPNSTNSFTLFSGKKKTEHYFACGIDHSTLVSWMSEFFSLPPGLNRTSSIESRCGPDSPRLVPTCYMRHSFGIGSQWGCKSKFFTYHWRICILKQTRIRPLKKPRLAPHPSNPMTL